MASPTPKGDPDRIELRSPHFIYRLDTSSGLRSESWTNLLSGRLIALAGGPELELEIDASEGRIWITGWRTKCTQEMSTDPDEEYGYLQGFSRPEFDDREWRGTPSPSIEGAHADPRVEDKYYWARTHVFLPLDLERTALALHLGGFGLFDYSYIRVFMNGQEIGERHARKRWNEPGIFDLGPASEAHRFLRFGQDNVIAVQATGYRARTRRMDELDPSRTRHLPGKCQWPAQFEQHIVVGQHSRTPALRIVDWGAGGGLEAGTTVIGLASEDSTLVAKLTYRWDHSEPVLRRSTTITNRGSEELTLLSVRMGSYTSAGDVSEGEQGFPAYLGDDAFATLAHPSGWARGQDRHVNLSQYPGRGLRPGETFECMEVVLGVAAKGRAREGFLSHVRGRSRRVTRGHDGAYAILEPFGARPGQIFDETEEFVLDNIEKVAQGQNESGCHFDLYSVDFWVDYRGDIERFDLLRFPNGLSLIRERLEKLGTSPGLWIDSSMPRWTIGGNPVVQPTFTYDLAYDGDCKALCRATDPVKTMYSTAFRHHIRENGVRLCKFDNLQAICYNPNHDHLPGIYSTEAIQSAVIETLEDLDAECPEVFLMLYWGHRSPWWLLHADTLFEPGLGIEAASPSRFPAPYVRDSVTLGLDQAQWWCNDIPPLGKDSLGVWLSDWKWNSSVGKERWQEGFVMDICRGSLLAQPWSDEDWLSPAERKQMAEFISLLKANVDCFSNPRFVVGNPWKHEPYGYCCTNGRRAFVSLNNCTWKDANLAIRLGPEWGLANGVRWDVYRWYPDPAQLRGPTKGFSGHVKLALRPFQTILLELVPRGESPSLGREFPTRALPRSFDEAARDLEVVISPARGTDGFPVPNRKEDADHGLTMRAFDVRCSVPACRTGGLVVISASLGLGQVSAMIGDLGKSFAASATIDGRECPCEPVVKEETYPACWEAWRIGIGPSGSPRSIQLRVSAVVSPEAEATWDAHLVPL